MTGTLTSEPPKREQQGPSANDTAWLTHVQDQVRHALDTHTADATAAAPPPRPWHVVEIGFGLGLHFLSSWQAWRNTAHRSSRLFYTAVGLSWPCAEHWQGISRRWPELQALTDPLTPLWHGLMPGMHRLVLDGGRVQLTVCVGEPDKMLRELDTAADCLWITQAFLSSEPPASGAAPCASPLQGVNAQRGVSQRPQIPWPALSRLCKTGTHLLITENAAPDLLDADPAWHPSGFAQPSFSATGSVTARYQPAWTPRQRLRQSLPPQPLQALVIGAGLSGSAVAHSLAMRGWSVTVIDQGSGVGAGASGLPAGLAAPHVSPDDSVLSRISRAGVRATLQRAQSVLKAGSDWAHSGVLEHRVEGKRSLPAGDAWPAAGHTWSTPASAAQIAAAGVPETSSALWHGLAGWIRPRQLVAAQLQTPGVQVLWGQRIDRIERTGESWSALDAQGRVLGQAPLLVIASAYDSMALLNNLPELSVPLNPLRGQISYGAMTELNEAQRQPLPPFPVNGHGSFIHGVPSPQGQHSWYIGSTFERDCTQAPVRETDHAANQLRLAKLLPELGHALKPSFDSGGVQGWAGLRCTLPDRLPAVGPIDEQRYPGLWMSAGMGARGISLAVLCGELTAAWLHNEPLPLAPSLAKHLMAQRFARH